MFRSRINVLMLLLGNTFPPDIRVEKEASSLSKAKYNVFILTRRKEGQAYSEIFKGIHILRASKPVRIRILSYLIDRLILPLKTMFVILKYNIKILHVHDLPYALMITLLGKICRRKVVFDMHEPYVDMIKETLKKGVSARSKLGRLWIFYMRLSELLACKLATKVVVVTKEIAERLIRLGIPKNKIVIVLNTANLENLKRIKKKTRKRCLKNKFIVSYIGGFGYHRGIDTVIKALPLMIKKAPSIHFLIVGDHSKQRGILENQCKQLGVEEYVTFTGWVAFNEAMEYMRITDLGVIPYHSTPFTNAAIPHKLFQYMYFEKPVLVSDVKLLKKIVKDAECGVVFRASDYVQLADKIIKLINNSKLMKEMGKKGRKAVESKYNWNVDGMRLLQLYSELR